VARQRRRATLREVAAQAGVSLGTASLAMNGSALIRPETRARVVAAAERLDYVPNRQATRLLQGYSDCIGVVFMRDLPTSTSDTLHFMMLRGITETLEEHGYTVRLVRLGAEDGFEPQGRRRPLSAQDVDGLITVNWLSPALLEPLRAIGVPLVALDASGAYPYPLSVDADERGGVAEGVGYLLQLGHRRVALLNLPMDSAYAQETVVGYTQALQREGLRLDHALIRTSTCSITGGRLAMADLLTMANPPTAVFAVTDEIAVGAMQAIAEAGLRVADDVSVVGMSDIELAAQTRPALTTVRIEAQTLGRQAAELLVGVIAGQRVGPERIVLPTRLIVRDSALAPPVRAGSLVTR
jgi:DNA-binding LacI/PurR family transcriptional regulator